MGGQQGETLIIEQVNHADNHICFVRLYLAASTTESAVKGLRD